MSTDAAQELARLARALGSHARRAAWRGQDRIKAPATAVPDEQGASGRSHHSGPGHSVIGAKGRPGTRPEGPSGGAPSAAIHNPPPTQGQTEARAPGSPGKSEKAPLGAPPGSPARVAPAAKPLDPAAQANREGAVGCGDLALLRELVGTCKACPLHTSRTQTVFQDGSEAARVLFVGEAPGRDEDLRGIPFVGAAGKLLTDIIEKGMGLRREEVAIANVLKCRPPHNRDPQPLEKERCTPFLDRQIELIDPEVIIPLGRHASQHLLRTQASMSRMRGRIFELGSHKVVPTYHPAYLLRNPEAKGACWQDIQVAMGILGLRPPTKGS